MYFNIKLILFIVICSFVSGQNYFNRALGNRVSSISAKSTAMGGIGFMNNQTSSISIINPAYLMNNPGLKVDVNYNNLYISENRSFPSIDFFEDYYADLTYVVNSQSHSAHNIGVSYVSDGLGISAATGPFISTDYNFVEEVRNSNDELVGYFQFETSGVIICNSYGLALSSLKRFHLGLSLNQLLQTTLTSYRNDNQNIVDRPSSPTSKQNFTTISIWVLPATDIELSIGHEQDARIQYTSLLEITMDEAIGLPQYDTASVMISNELYKPSYSRIGLTHKPSQIHTHRLTIEYEKAEYSNYEIDSIKLEDVHTLGIGIEYNIYNFVPLRVGLTYRTSPLRSDLSKTIFSFGTGWDSKHFNIDIGCRYWNISYPYKDIFPVQGDNSNPSGVDIVKENNLNISLSLQYRF